MLNAGSLQFNGTNGIFEKSCPTLVSAGEEHFLSNISKKTDFFRGQITCSLRDTSGQSAAGDYGLGLSHFPKVIESIQAGRTVDATNPPHYAS